MRTKVGFTLLEIMVSLMILTTVAVGVIGTVAFTKRSGAGMQQQLNAIQLMEKKIAEIKVEKTGALSTQVESIASADLPNGVLAYTVREVAVGGQVDPHLFEIETNIYWDYGWLSKVNSCSSTQLSGCDKKATLRTVYFRAS